MACEMKNFMDKLAEDSAAGQELRDAWTADPITAGRNENLTLEQIAILLRGWKQEVEAALAAEDEAADGACGGKYIITPWGISK